MKRTLLVLGISIVCQAALCEYSNKPSDPVAPVDAAFSQNRAAPGIAPPVPLKSQCQQVPPEMPGEAIAKNIQGKVTLVMQLDPGGALQVTYYAGPTVYMASVFAAIAKYKCVNDGPTSITATQEFVFRLED